MTSRARAVWSFDGELEGDMSFQAGDVIVVTDTKHMSWWRGYVEGGPERSGLLPRNYVEPIVDDTDEEESIRKARRGSTGVVPGAGGALFTIRSRARVNDLRVTSAESKLSRFPDGSLELHSWYKIEVDTGRLRVVEKRYREFCELESQFRRMFPQLEFAPSSGLRSSSLLTAPRTARTMERRRKAAQSFLRSTLHDDGVAALTIAFLFPDHGAEMEGPASGSLLQQDKQPSEVEADSLPPNRPAPPTLPDRAEEQEADEAMEEEDEGDGGIEETAETMKSPRRNHPLTVMPPELPREDPGIGIQPQSPSPSTLASGFEIGRKRHSLCESNGARKAEEDDEEEGKPCEEAGGSDDDGDEDDDDDAVRVELEDEGGMLDVAATAREEESTFRQISLLSLDAFDDLLEQGYCIVPGDDDDGGGRKKRYARVGDRVTISYALLVWDGAETHARLVQRVRRASFRLAEPATPAARTPLLPTPSTTTTATASNDSGSFSRPDVVPLSPGLHPALQLIPEGETVRLILTPEAGLGETGWLPTIPSNVHLVYDVTLHRTHRTRRDLVRQRQQQQQSSPLSPTTTSPSHKNETYNSDATAGNDDDDDRPVSLTQIRESIHARYAHAVGPQAGQRHSFAKQSVSREIPRATREGRPTAATDATVGSGTGPGSARGSGVNASQIARGEVSMEQVESMLRASVAADLEQRTQHGSVSEGGSGLLPNRMDTEEEEESDVDDVEGRRRRGGGGESDSSRKSWWSLSSSFSFSRGGKRRSETIGTAGAGAGTGTGRGTSSSRPPKQGGDRVRSGSEHEAARGGKRRPMHRFRNWLGGRASMQPQSPPAE